MRIEVGTLKEICAQVGDVVEWSGGTGLRRWTIGLIRGVNYYEGDDHDAPLSRLPHWRIISRANQGPVREVTRKEIVPGVYGKLSVGFDGPNGELLIDLTQGLTEDELTAAITTLTQIRDAMADSGAT